MSTETTEKAGRGGSRGPRTYKKPTPRERVLADSLAAFVKDSTGRDVSTDTVHAVRWCFSRWAEDPATKQLRDDMDNQLKRQKAIDKKQKALAALKEAEADLLDVDDIEESDEEDIYGDTAEDSAEEEEDDELFEDDDEKVSTSF